MVVMYMCDVGTWLGVLVLVYSNILDTVLKFNLVQVCCSHALDQYQYYNTTGLVPVSIGLKATHWHRGIVNPDFDFKDTQ